MMLNINGKEVFVPLVGRFNVSNLLCIYGAALNLGFMILGVWTASWLVYVRPQRKARLATAAAN